MFRDLTLTLISTTEPIKPFRTVRYCPKGTLARLSARTLTQPRRAEKHTWCISSSLRTRSRQSGKTIPLLYFSSLFHRPGRFSRPISVTRFLARNRFTNTTHGTSSGSELFKSSRSSSPELHRTFEFVKFRQSAFFPVCCSTSHDRIHGVYMVEVRIGNFSIEPNRTFEFGAARHLLIFLLFV